MNHYLTLIVNVQKLKNKNLMQLLILSIVHLYDLNNYGYQMYKKRDPSFFSYIKFFFCSQDDHASIEHDVSSIVSSIDAQVSSLFNQLLATNSSSISNSHSDQSIFLHQPHRLVYAKKTDSNENNRFIKPTDFDRETTNLNTIQTNIDQHIEKQRIILDTLSHQFENVMIV